MYQNNDLVEKNEVTPTSRTPPPCGLWKLEYYLLAN